MATTTNLKEKLANKSQSIQEQPQTKEVSNDPRKQMGSLLTRMEGQFKKALGETIKSEKFNRIALSLYTNNKAFWSCDSISFISALMLSAQAGLEPNTILGEAYLIPYNGKITFQLGYKGILALCNRTQLYKKIYARAVYKEDLFDYEYGLETILKHKPADVQTGEPTHYYAVYQTINGGEDFVVWSRDKVINHAKKFSKSFTKPGSPWQEHFDSMAMKTCIIDVLKYAPKTTEIARSMAYDDKDQADVKAQLADSGEEELDIALDLGMVVDADFKEVPVPEPEAKVEVKPEVKPEVKKKVIVEELSEKEKKEALLTDQEQMKMS